MSRLSRAVWRCIPTRAIYRDGSLTRLGFWALRRTLRKMPRGEFITTTEERTSMTDIGKVTHDGATHRAQCLREDCPWTFESTKDGEAGHQLMEHNTDVHAAQSERGTADAGFLLTFLVVLGLVMIGTGVVVLVDAVIS